jgi:flagellar biosynthesis chaperone FliJ
MPRVKQKISHNGITAAHQKIKDLQRQRNQVNNKLTQRMQDVVVANRALANVAKQVMREQKERYGGNY